MALLIPGQPHPVHQAQHALSRKDEGQLVDAKTGMQRGWQPYQDNGGSALAVAGKDFVVVAADTRMSNGYAIMDRNMSKCYELPGGHVLATGGMQADRTHLQKNIQHRLTHYEYDNKKTASVGAVAQMLSIQLYNRRFFPLYCYNLLCGINEAGEGCVYSYDVVGCLERRSHQAVGSARDQIEPILDLQMNRYNMQGVGPNVDITVEDAVDMCKDAITAAGERDLETGDGAEIWVITKDGTKKEVIPLKKD
eukprot:TRINITY_DN20759_c0_g1_i1.p1 TRINITY_DN20759_c0_g1~~TRINITY_DN20759_c0_g1_i1.p1  ORF type:complete len:251 (+),score=106.91 TRINITY_DN20759_c0_g1_i1:54-806(+)